MTIPLEKQVCSLALAKRLKELGVGQESLYYWVEKVPEYAWVLSLSRNGDDYPVGEWGINAFTVAELGEMLNTKHPSVFVSYREKLMGDQRYWICVSRVAIEPLKENDYQLADTEADARAKMLIYLLENKLITV